MKENGERELSYDNYVGIEYEQLRSQTFWFRGEELNVSGIENDPKSLPKWEKIESVGGVKMVV